MPNTRCDKIFAVDGYKISVTFADAVNPAAISHAKQILLSSFASRAPQKSPIGTVAIYPEQRDNIGEGSPHVP